LDVSTTSTKCLNMTTVTGRTDLKKESAKESPKDQNEIRMDKVQKERAKCESAETKSRKGLKTSEEEEESRRNKVD
jgi:hypothetical protein